MWFLHQWERLNSNRTKSNVSMCESSESEEELDAEVEFEDDLDYLRSLDPKETKDQDHYRVLGLSKLRMAATDDQIKKAHRFKVLKHHPDKRKAAGEEVQEGDDYFSCITKALDVLGNPQTRRAFDSVDPTFDDDVPDALKKEKQENFLQVFRPKFEQNSRWSTINPVPQLGDNASSREQVDRFYSFWFEFSSWREYSYLDEEDKEKAGDKWERREIDKINKAQRKEKKAEETKRIRKLVDNAYNSDPRIARFRKEELEEKAAKKKAKADQAKARRDEEERIRKEAEAEQERIKEAEEAEKLRKAGAAKAEKEAQKKALKAERKKLRTLAKENNMFATTPAESTDNLLEMEKMCEVYDTAQLAALVARLTKDPALARRVFLSEIAALNGRMDDQRALEAESTEKTEGGVGSSKAGGVEWSKDELQLLIKAVKLFPAGTNQRWDVVTEFVNQHNGGVAIRGVKETISKAKELQGSNFATSSLLEEVNKAAYENLQKGQKKEVLERCAEESKGTERTETPADQQGLNPTPWTPDEQKLLEQALKTFDSKTPERWERISEAVPGRSKKDCMKRYKELAEIVKAKKAAQLAAAKKKGL